MRSYLCFRRLNRDDLAGSKWSIATQRVGNWIEVKELYSNKWHVAQILDMSPTEIRVQIPTWRKSRDEFLTRSMARNRVAKLGTNTNLYMSPSYPSTRKQGSLWTVEMGDLVRAREEFDRAFFDASSQETYLVRQLIPFIERSLLCMFGSNEIAEEIHEFRQHVLTNLVAALLSAEAATMSESTVTSLLVLTRMILNGHNSCTYFYLKYPGNFSASKYQKLVFTSYLTTPDALATIPSRHPCRSYTYIDSVEIFFQAGGFRVILQRLSAPEVPLTEVVLFCMILNQAKPCLVQRRRRQSAIARNRSSPSAEAAQMDDFFREFLNAAFARLRRMKGDELKDDEGLIDQIVSVLDMIYRDGILLGGNSTSLSDYEQSDVDGSNGFASALSSACDPVFAEAIEIFHLDLSKKFICCPFLSQRLMGISRINDIIAMAQRKDAQQKKTNLTLKRAGSSLMGSAEYVSKVSFFSSSSASSSSSSQSVTKWLRGKYVAEWLAASDVPEVILGDKDACAKYNLNAGTHLELLKRSKKILEFVASNGVLSEQLVMLLWKTGMSLQRSGRKTVFDVLSSLCAVFTADLLDILAGLLTQVPVAEFDDLLIHFIKRVIVIASKQLVEVENAGSKRSLSNLVGVTGGSQQKLSTSAQKDVDIFSKVVNLGCCLLWNGVLMNDPTDTFIQPEVHVEMENALADSLNFIQKLWVSSSSASSSVAAKEQQQLLNDYVKNCAYNIKTGALVEMSMSLIQRIVEGYGGSGMTPSLASSTLSRASPFTSSKAASSSTELLRDLNAKFDILSVTVDEIKRYMKYDKIGGSMNPPESDHRTAMEKRLSFLGYLLMKSDLTLSYDSITQLWECFNGANNSQIERETFFEWFRSVIPDPNNFVQRAYTGNMAFSSVVASEVFQSLINAMQHKPVNGIYLDMSTMSRNAFWSLERLFRFVNTSDKMLSCLASSTKSVRSGAEKDNALFTVESMELKGLDAFYEVALSAKDESVSKEAINYLIYLQLHVGSKLVRREVWTDFVKDCILRLKNRVQSSKGDRIKEQEIHRLLLILGTFLHQSVVYSNEHSSGSGASDAIEELIVYVKTQDGKNSAPFRYHLRRTSLVSELRDRISKDTGHPADRVRIVNEFKTKLTAQGHNKFSLEKARIFSGTMSMPSTSLSSRVSLASTVPAPSKQTRYIEAVLLTKVESDTIGHVKRIVLDYDRSRLGSTASATGTDSDWNATRLDISNNSEWLRLLYDLLSYKGGICEEAWKVLKLLTFDSLMEKQVRTLKDVLAIDGSICKTPMPVIDWDMLLDPVCPPKLLYQLELVERFALSDGMINVFSSNSDRFDTEANEWSRSFMALGGRAHLERIILSCIPNKWFEQGALAIMCASKLLKLLRHFVLAGKIEDQEGSPASDPENLVYQLMNILNNILNMVDESTSRNDPTESVSDDTPTNLGTEDSSRIDIRSYERPIVSDPDNAYGIPNEAYLLTRALSAITSYLLNASRPCLPILQSYSSHGHIMLSCLVGSRFQSVRQEAANAIVALSTTRNKIEEDRLACCHHFLKLLSEYTKPVHDEEYYNVYSLLISSTDNLERFDILPACRTLSQRVKAFVAPKSGVNGSSSARASGLDVSSSDSLLEALLSTFLSILKKIPVVLADPAESGQSLREVIASTLHDEEGILHELFHRCLFATPSDLQEDQMTSLTAGAQQSNLPAGLQQPKCRSDSCRKLAFDLVTELSLENIKGLRYILVQMSIQHSLTVQTDAASSLKALSASKRKAMKSASKHHLILERGKYVGLKNLGCTCYLNSTIQAFFMIPRFRRQILRLKTEITSQSSDTNSLIYELQLLFAHLETSAKPHYNPKSFTAALKTWDGGSIDVSVQQDASEFLTSFFQQVESELNGMIGGMNGMYSGDENVLNTFFGGTFSNELVAEGGKYSEGFEPFHYISVPVRDHKSLTESLDTWVKGEKVSYTWEQNEEDEKAGRENVAVETHKRVSIHKLPEYLIIHLKRFEFDFERMQQIKLHDQFEFPMELDMYPYTKEGQQEQRRRSSSAVAPHVIDDNNESSSHRSGSVSDSSTRGHNDGQRLSAPEYSQYTLSGTVVHMGTAHSGHYYSFLRGEQEEGDAPEWYEFNDTVVSPFDPKNIPEECFGGEDDRLRRSSSTESSTIAATSSRMKNRSSFMLIYSRVPTKVNDCGLTKDSRTLSLAASSFVLLFCTKLKRKARVRLEYLRSVANVTAPETIRQLIAKENRLFWRKTYLYDDRCISFTYDLVKTCLIGFEASKTMAVPPRFEPIEARLEALQMATKFVFGTLWQGGNVTQVLAWHPVLHALYHDEVDGCRWFLRTMSTNETLLLDLLVFNPHAEVRELMGSVVSEAIATTSNIAFEEESTRAVTSESSSGRDDKQLPASFEFIFNLIQLMPALLTVPIQHHHQYFLTIWDFVQTGRNEGAFLVVNSVVGAIVALLTGMGSTQPLLQAQLQKVKSKQILKSIDLNTTVLKLVSLLIRCGLPPAMDVERSHRRQLPPNMAQDYVDFSRADQEVLCNDRFLTLLTQRANWYTKETKPLEQIVMHLCWESQAVTSKFMDKILHGIVSEDHHDVKPYFRTFNSLLKIRDSLARARVTDGMTRVLAAVASQQQYYKATETSIDMLTRLAKRHPSTVGQWLQDNQRNCAWMEKWLMAHRGGDGYLQQRKTSLVKPNSTSSWVSVSVTSSGLIKAVDRTVARLVPRLRSMLDPAQFGALEPFYDSDDNPQRLVGKRVRVKWAKDKWYEGRVAQFNEPTYEHFVVYDDGDQRSYRMSDKVFTILETPVVVPAPTSS